MVEWHPSFSARLDRAARLQALRALLFMIVGLGTVVGAFVVSSVGLESWRHFQAERTDARHYSALGLRHMCSGPVTTECLDLTASAAGVVVASIRHGVADMAVPVRPPDADAVAKLAPDPARTMYGHFNAVQYAGVEVADGSLLGVDIYSAPTTQPGYSYGPVRTVHVAGVDVRMRTAQQYSCARKQVSSSKLLYCPENVWAVWHHEGQLYAANFDSFRADDPSKFLRSPVQTLKLLFPKISYVAPR
jgi:hypothetical protein